MSKGKEQKNYGEYGYVGDEQIVISVQEFQVLKLAIDQAINNGVEVKRPQVLKWVNKEGKEVKFSLDKARKGEITQSVDVEATKSDENVQVLYDNALFPHIFSANEVIMGVHFRNVEEGVAKTKEEQEAYVAERKAKGQMKVEDDEAEVSEVETPNAPMGVVRDEPETEGEQSEDKE